MRCAHASHGTVVESDTCRERGSEGWGECGENRTNTHGRQIKQESGRDRKRETETETETEKERDKQKKERETERQRGM